MEEQETGTTFLNTHLLDGFCTVFSILPDWISGRVLQKKGGAKTPMPTSRNILKIPDNLIVTVESIILIATIC